MDSIRIKAMAKINLGLDVLGRRENGYHDVRMIMQSINLYDIIDIAKTTEPGIQLKTNLSYLPTNENNLVYKAAKVLLDEFQLGVGLSINLEKRIPVAAGLAGGSSDAAATMIGINNMFQLGLTKQELMERGVKLGADIPFCIMRGTALSEGIGEILTPLPGMPRCHIVIAKPDIAVSTKYVYDNLVLDEQTAHPDIDGIIDALNAENLDGVTSRLGNVLEQVTVNRYQVIHDIKTFLTEHGAMNALMSGSGPTVFGIFDDKIKAQAAKDALSKTRLAKDIVLTRCFNVKQ